MEVIEVPGVRSYPAGEPMWTVKCPICDVIIAYNSKYNTNIDKCKHFKGKTPGKNVFQFRKECKAKTFSPEE